MSRRRPGGSAGRLHRSALVLLAVLFASGRPGTGDAFEFDGWRSGMGLQEILAVARTRDLAIAPSSLLHTARHYDHRVATRGAGTHGAYTYPTRLLGRPARVTLELAPNRRTLHTLLVSWSPAGAPAADRLEADLAARLTRRYGEPSRPEPGSLGGYLFEPEARQWAPGPDDRLLVETRAGVVQLRCVDLRRRERAAREGRP